MIRQSSMRRFLVLSAVLTFAPLAVAMHAGSSLADAVHGTWSEIAITHPAAPARTSIAMIHDTSNNRMVVFSGDPGQKNDTWGFPLGVAPEWQDLAPASPPPGRYGAAAAYDPIGNRMLMFGGYRSGLQLRDLWELSMSGTPAWNQITTSGPHPFERQDVAAVFDAAANRFVIFFGYGGTSFLNEVWALSLGGTPTWTQLTPAGPLPPPRTTGAYAYDPNHHRLLVFGGYNSGGYLADAWSFDLSTETWSQITTPTSPPARRQAYAAYDAQNDRLVVFGGYDDSYSSRQDLWSLSLAGTPAWTQTVIAGPSPRYGGAALYDPARKVMMIYGGVAGPAWTSEVWSLELGGPMAWARVKADPITRRRDYVAAYRASGNDVFLFGGETPGGNSDETWRLVLGGGLPGWQRVFTYPSPAPRHSHRGVWDPVRQRLIIFGGYSTTYLSDLWAFSPSTSAWTAITTTGTPPSGKMLGGLVYDPDADRLVAFGGHAGGTTHFNDLFQLPLTGPNAFQWSPLAFSGTPPSPRWVYGMQYDPPRHRAVLFGGNSDTGRENDVWALSLTGTPIWTQLSPLGTPPIPRSDHTMIYEPIGDRMIVFGGYDNASFLNDAWALNLGGGTPLWQPLSPAGGPPSVRDIIQGVYDPLNQRMLVYGGYDGASHLNDTWALQWDTPPVPVLASLIDAVASPGSVRLNWFVSGAPAALTTVERREGAGEWRSLGSAEPTGLDRLTYEDRSVLAGVRYGYRLRIVDSNQITMTDEVLVDVPNGYRLELAGITPNPTAGDRFAIAFTLSRRSAARLDVLDVAGRQVVSRDLSAFEPGRHRLAFDEGARLLPGVYVIRLAAEGRVLSSKALVVR